MAQGAARSTPAMGMCEPAFSPIAACQRTRLRYDCFPFVSWDAIPVLVDVDEVDRALLRLVQEDNQQSVRALAEQVGVSAPTCLRRIRLLRQRGVIRHNAALLDPAKLGLDLTCYAEVTLHSHSDPAVRAFGLRMRRLSQVLGCSEIAGDSDFLLHVIAKDMAAFSDFARVHLASDSNVKSYRSLFVIREHKSEHCLPI